MAYKGKDRRQSVKVFGCLEMHYRDVGLFFGNIFRVAEEERDKIMKAYKIIGVKKGKPIEEIIDNYDEQAARAEFEAEYDEPFDDPMDEQHFNKEKKLLRGF